MFSYAKNVVEMAEAAVESGGVAGALTTLRQLPLDDFGEVFISLPNPALPNLSSALPRMAAEQTQVNWTGSSGIVLLRQTDTFVRLLAHNYESLSGRKLPSSRILDFGCGYGRIMRALYYFADPENLYGCDPWDISIDICKEDGVLGHFAISDYLPKSLPFEGKFDLIYAFSVFTHLSERATTACLTTMADALAPGGVAAITIRPVEYWDFDQRFNDEERKALVANHNDTGFAFSPHNRSAVDGDVTYGDTSMTFEYLRSVEPRLHIRKVERTFDDPFQIVVFMTAS